MPHDPDLTPVEEQVRRLLAEARHDEPVPDDVAERLDGVLADLADERRRAARSVTVAADLAAARRRRTARNLLVAAAAVVAIGFGLNAVDLTVSGGDEDGAGGSAQSADKAAPGATALESQQDRPGGRPAKPEGAPSPGDGLLRSDAAFPAPVTLSSDRFGVQVRRLRADGKELSLYDSYTPSDAAADRRSRLGALRSGCPTTGWGDGLLVPVSYDGDLGALLFRPATGETQVVDLYLCGVDEPTRSITLPAR